MTETAVDTPRSGPLAKAERVRSEKQRAHLNRIERTLAACFLGLIAGWLSFVLGGTPDANMVQPNALLGLVILAAAIVVQRHLFILLGLDTPPLGGKDWFYQGFMTFALWFITLTILLTTSAPAAL
jgi:predicted membrane-bound spermidine synthase